MLRSSNRVNEDEWLGVSLKQGNQQSFGLFYDKYAPAISGIIIRIVNDEKMAEEILNLAFVNAWNQIASFNSSKTSLFSWLINIARQTAFDEIKSVHAKNLQYTNSVYEANTDGSLNNALINDKNQTSSFDLVYYKGLNFTQAAAELQITVPELINNIKMTIENLKEKEVL